MEWVIAHLLKGLAKIPGMSDLLGFEAQDVETNFRHPDLYQEIGI